jgi:hypothetical protein
LSPSIICFNLSAGWMNDDKTEFAKTRSLDLLLASLRF